MAAIQAKIFWSGGRQAIRLPKTMRLPGTEVRITRRGKTLVLSPTAAGEGWDDFWEQLLPLAESVKRHATRAAGPALAAVLVVSAVLLGASPASAQHANPLKLAVIDLRRAVVETEQGLRVQATLRKLFDSRQVEKAELVRAVPANKTPKGVLQKRYEELIIQDQELQKLTLDDQREMQRKEQEMMGPILAGILEAVKRIAEQEGYDMVLEKSAVPYFRGDLELTDRAIQMYNGGTATPALPSAPAPKAPAPGPNAPKK